jgi:hypothetical protein
MKQIEPKALSEFQPGAILEDQWGWEQTTVDFYCIIDRKGDWVTILPMFKNTSPEIGFMTNEETPGAINYNAKPVRKKIKSWNGKESGFSFRNYAGGGWCRLWDGEPAKSTHYA